MKTIHINEDLNAPYVAYICHIREKVAILPTTY